MIGRWGSRSVGARRWWLVKKGAIWPYLIAGALAIHVVVSLIVALTLIPMLASREFRSEAGAQPDSRAGPAIAPVTGGTRRTIRRRSRTIPHGPLPISVPPTIR